MTHNSLPEECWGNQIHGVDHSTHHNLTGYGPRYMGYTTDLANEEILLGKGYRVEGNAFPDAEDSQKPLCFCDCDAVGALNQLYNKHQSKQTQQKNKNKTNTLGGSTSRTWTLINLRTNIFQYTLKYSGSHWEHKLCGGAISK